MAKIAEQAEKKYSTKSVNSVIKELTASNVKRPDITRPGNSDQVVMDFKVANSQSTPKKVVYIPRAKREQMKKDADEKKKKEEEVLPVCCDNIQERRKVTLRRNGEFSREEEIEREKRLDKKRQEEKKEEKKKERKEETKEYIIFIVSVTCLTQQRA